VQQHIDITLMLSLRTPYSIFKSLLSLLHRLAVL
jgi:hypothetical protein